MKNSNTKNISLSILFLSLTISVVTGWYFIFGQHTNLAYFDASTRLNIARRIFDNLTPGLAQIGNVWPPFPQILMLPFVTSDYLWRTGIAGWVVSGFSYVLSSIVFFKLLFTITENKVVSFIGTVTLFLNINLIYLQATAMSESFFILTIIGMVYFLTKYIKTNDVRYLFPGAIMTFLSTLTRYEGYALALGSIVIVFLIHFLNPSKRKKTESTVILYALPSLLGIFLWSVYLWAIFGDPLYWLHYYADVQIAQGAEVMVKPSIVEAVGSYTTSIFYMCGFITSIFGFLGMIFFLFDRKVVKEYKYLLIFPLAIFLFMIATITRNTVIDQPPLTLYTIFEKGTNVIKEFNIRYGLSFLPFLVLFGITLITRVRLLILPYVILIFLQTFSYFSTPLFLIYQLRLNVHYGIAAHSEWMRKHYDNGLILISAMKHDPEMIQMNLPYKTYIHEGTQKYWLTSVKDPTKYAKWVIFDSNNPQDQVTKSLKDSDILRKKYDLAYDVNGVKIYKVK